MTKKTRMIVLTSVAALLFVVLIVGNALAAYFGEMITQFLGGDRPWSAENIDLEAGDALAQEISAEGIILFKNNGALPLAVEAMPDKPTAKETDAAWKKTKVSVFGWGASDGGWVMGGSGSGSSTDRGSGDVRTFSQGMSEGGFELYQPVMDMMKDYRATRVGAPAHINGAYPFFFFYEPTLAQYQEHIAGAKAHSEIGIVVISRLGGEGVDLRYEQRHWNGGATSNNSTNGSTLVSDRTYLDTTANEDALLELVMDNFKTVIVIVNTCNAMNLSFTDDDRIDAVISVGGAGQSGSLATADILRGMKSLREEVTNSDGSTKTEILFNEDGEEVLDKNGDPVEVPIYKKSEYSFSPSGRTTGTWLRDFKADPTYAISGHAGVSTYSGGGAYFDYVEDMYMGYHFFETAAHLAENGKYAGFDYAKAVFKPFGFGMSYTKFDWAVESVSPARGSSLTKDGTISVGVTVTNTGSRSGKDVVQLYSTAPYYDNGIEKPFVKLAAFAKTKLLFANDECVDADKHADPETCICTETVTLSFKVKDLASYDAYNKSKNKAVPDGGYIIEEGAYQIKIQSNAHTLADVSGATIDYTVDEDITYIEDVVVTKDKLDINKNKVGEASKTLKAAKNLFTGDSAYSGIAIDGGAGQNIKFMSRMDFAGTFPAVKAGARTRPAVASMADGWNKSDTIAGAVAPTQGVAGPHRFYEETSANTKWDISKPNLDLLMRLGADYNDPLWDQVLNQIPLSTSVNGQPGGNSSGGSLETLVGRGGWRTSHVDAIGKPWNIDLDGPSGLNESVAANSNPLWTAFPVTSVLAQSWDDELAYWYGLAVGAEAKATGVSGWYAPAPNMHRSPFMGRNFEYYSEDALISGRMAAETSRGALTNGLYPYIKHFVVNDCETNRSAVYTWLTEQALREIYLRPFEIAIKEGDANGIMSSFNRLGSVWTGGNRALLTNVVRDEWGFRGSVVTDWTTGGNYMNVDQGLRAGNDLWLTGQQNMPGGFDDKSSATAQVLMRQASKNILFTLASTYYYEQTAERPERAGEVLTITPPPPLGFAWWAIWGMLPFNLIFVAGILVCLAFAFPAVTAKIFKKKPKMAAAAVGADGGVGGSSAEPASVFEEPAAEAAPAEPVPIVEPKPEPVAETAPAEKPKTGKTKKPNAEESKTE